MKLLTIAVPCYNSEGYLRKCVDSLLTGREDVEILLINDGSTDGTGDICDEYARTHPAVVKAVHQENGGHGEGVNQGIRLASGLYFKVVDSDDWVDGPSFLQVLEVLGRYADQGLDLLICNYVYEKVSEGKQVVSDYVMSLPQNRLFTWDEAEKLPLSRYILMHSVIYRTEVLRQSGVVLPKHTFYVDNIFAYVPLPYVRKLYYLSADFYRYFIGREDQSVNERIMINRVDQQLRVTQLMLSRYSCAEMQNFPPMLADYMKNCLAMMIAVTSILLIKSKNAENEEKRRALWRKLNEDDPDLCRQLRRKTLSVLSKLPGRTGKLAAVMVYTVAKKVYKFN